MTENLVSKQTRAGRFNARYLYGGKGEPLVIIHGGGEGARSWLKTARDLTGSYTVYIPDLPGFGRTTPGIENHKLSDFVDFMESFTTALGLDSFYLVGHSFGSGVALQYSYKFPNKVKKLVLVNGLYLSKDVPSWLRLLSSPAVVKVIGSPVLYLFKGIGWLFKHLLPFEFRDPLPQAKFELAGYISSFKEQAGAIVDRLSELLMPTLLVCGGRDIIVPVNQAYSAARVIPNCQVRVFKKAGHHVYAQESEEFARLIKKFLD